MSKSLLIEIGCEELPTGGDKGLLLNFAKQLQNNLLTQLKQAQLIEKNINEPTIFATPRRLACLIPQVAEEQPQQMIERRGPALAAAFDQQGKPTPATLGFARSCGVEVDALEKLETPQGAWLVFRKQQAGQNIKQILPALVNEAINKIQIVKPMRWADSTVEFIRPVHWIIMLHGEDLIPAEILEIKADRITYGHRFHHPAAIEISTADEYEKVLEAANVIVNFSKRQQLIEQQILKEAHTLHGKVASSSESYQDLLVEVTSLVEWPVVLRAHFDEKFLQVPAEALMSSMQHHQKCFPLQDQQGKLLPYFLLVSNLQSKDVQQIIAGNERVMRARLSDAEFFYHTDIKLSLADYVESLKTIIFQDKLGTLFDKTLRVKNLAQYIAQKITVESSLVERAAYLCKADLMTKMVGEFPELQGIMGYYYAEYAKEPHEVSLALRDQYKNTVPENPSSCILMIADRIDTLIGLFGINKIPTGSKDPFALRRAAADILAIIISKKYNLDLVPLIEQAINLYANQLTNNQVGAQVLSFFYDRLPGVFSERFEQDYQSVLFEAVLAKQVSAPYDFACRLDAVKSFIQLPQAEALAAANKRVSNILSKQGGANICAQIEAKYLIESAEIQLADQINLKKNKVAKLYESGNYTEVLSELADLKEPIDQFFDKVMVMVDDENLRNNRLAILQNLRHLFLQVADISLL